MKRKNVPAMLLAAALTLALLSGCAKTPNAQKGALTVTDMTGREIELGGAAGKIVALTAADVEILYALGAEDTLIGRGEFCDYPPEALEIPSVQSGYDTNIEQILALAPDVVLMATMAQPQEQVDALEKAGIRVVVSDAKNIAGTYTAIELIGAVTGKNDEAKAVIADMKAAFAELEAKSEKTGKTIYFEVSPLEYGLWASGAGTFEDDIAAIVGLTNVFSDVTSWASISEEQVIERDPDIILTSAMYFGEGPLPVEEILGRAGWRNIKAVRNGDVITANNDELTRPGPRLVSAARYLYDFVYGVS
jgi:iron complex transport system substrate-binding protein